jgi:hypothetical protein
MVGVSVRTTNARGQYAALCGALFWLELPAQPAVLVDNILKVVRDKAKQG